MDARAQREAEEPCRHVLLVLGCRLDGHGRPSAALARRLDLAHATWQADRACRLVLSGGGRPSEAAAMCTALVGRGVPRAQLVLEPEARDTRQNARLGWPLAVAQLAGGPEGGRVSVLTEHIHLPRSLMLVRGLAARVGPWPLPSIVGLAAADSPHRAERWRRRLHELLARARDRAWLWGRAGCVTVEDRSGISCE